MGLQEDALAAAAKQKQGQDAYLKAATEEAVESIKRYLRIWSGSAGIPVSEPTLVAGAGEANTFMGMISGRRDRVVMRFLADGLELHVEYYTQDVWDEKYSHTRTILQVTLPGDGVPIESLADLGQALNRRGAR
jgi:hypothetical protein